MRYAIGFVIAGGPRELASEGGSSLALEATSRWVVTHSHTPYTRLAPGPAETLIIIRGRYVS